MNSSIVILLLVIFISLIFKYYLFQLQGFKHQLFEYFDSTTDRISSIQDPNIKNAVTDHYNANDVVTYYQNIGDKNADNIVISTPNQAYQFPITNLIQNINTDIQNIDNLKTKYNSDLSNLNSNINSQKSNLISLSTQIKELKDKYNTDITRIQSENVDNTILIKQNQDDVNVIPEVNQIIARNPSPTPAPTTPAPTTPAPTKSPTDWNAIVIQNETNEENGYSHYTSVLEPIKGVDNNNYYKIAEMINIPNVSYVIGYIQQKSCFYSITSWNTIFVNFNNNFNTIIANPNNNSTNKIINRAIILAKGGIPGAFIKDGTHAIIINQNSQVNYLYNYGALLGGGGAGSTNRPGSGLEGIGGAGGGGGGGGYDRKAGDGGSIIFNSNNGKNTGDRPGPGGGGPGGGGAGQGMAYYNNAGGGGAYSNGNYRGGDGPYVDPGYNCAAGGGGYGGGKGGTSGAGAPGGGGGGGGKGGTSDAGNGGYSIYNNGSLRELYNLQGGNNIYGPLFYAGNIPTKYFIRVNSISNYGQLFCTGWHWDGRVADATNMSIDIDTTSLCILTGITKFPNVLSGFKNVKVNNITINSNTNIDFYPNDNNGNRIINLKNNQRYLWTLQQQSGTNNYDLLMMSLLDTCARDYASDNPNSKDPVQCPNYQPRCIGHQPDVHFGKCFM